jgi:hypothetical protein
VQSATRTVSLDEVAALPYLVAYVLLGHARDPGPNGKLCGCDNLRLYSAYGADDLYEVRGRCRLNQALAYEPPPTNLAPGKCFHA